MDRLDADTTAGRQRLAALLVAATGLLTALGFAYGGLVWPASTLVVPLVAGGLLLDPWRLRVVIATATLGLITLVAGDGWRDVRPVNVVVAAIVAVVAHTLATDRQRLGLSVGRGESMLIELRDTLERQGEPPPIPAQWHVEVARRPAGGGSFSGDFLVTELTQNGRVLECALVDVSGKGIDAGTRSLLLSGAFGGLLGSVPTEDFLPAANSYLLRQHWEEGFATSVHVALDLDTGEYRIANAGHPSPAHLAGGSGRWSLVEGSGTLLGLVPDADFGVTTGLLRPHDALLLYTDGLVEIPGRDIDDGIDRLLGHAERLVSRGFQGGAELLIDSAASEVNDDRALLLIWRMP